MFVIVGSNGPCKISVNVGGKLFRTHHDEIMKGLVHGGSIDFSEFKQVPQMPKIPLWKELE